MKIGQGQFKDTKQIKPKLFPNTTTVSKKAKKKKKKNKKNDREDTRANRRKHSKLKRRSIRKREMMRHQGVLQRRTQR